MKTLGFHNEIIKSGYEVPPTRGLGKSAVFEGFVVLKIEEFNLRLFTKIIRSYRIHYRNRDGELRYFDCALNSGVYHRYVVPNVGRLEIMKETYND